MFLASLEGSVVATAMPSVIRSLGGAALYSLPFAVYMLAATVSGPLWGTVSDLHGRRRVYLLAVLAFVLGSTACGLSNNMGTLVAMRALQGVGAGGILPLTLTMAADLYGRERRAGIQGFFSGVNGLSAILGPLIGGLLTSALGWRFVFLVNLPFAFLAVIPVLMLFPDPRHAHHDAERVDWTGGILLAVGIGTLVWALQVHDARFLWLAAPAWVAFALVERAARHPIFPATIVQDPTIRIGLLANLAAGAAYFGLITYLPLYAQTVTQAGPVAAGALLTPMSLSWTVASLTASRLLKRIPARTLTILGATTLTVGFVAFRLLLGHGLWLLALASILIGVGMGLTMLTLMLTIQAAAAGPRLGVVTSSILLMRNAGSGLGASAMGAIIGAGTQVPSLLAAGLGRA
ncbi:MAG TPA: MFS transporter, partial [Deinococcales bacterium]|nr:MFS transporter [Deinococcales bacterium]